MVAFVKELTAVVVGAVVFTLIADGLKNAEIATTAVQHPAELRADIRETRERMSQTLDGIGERLNPQVLKQQVRDEIQERKQQLKENIREATIGRAQHMARDAAGRVTETRRGIADAIRERLRSILVVQTRIELVPWGSLRRSEYKSKLVER